MTLATHMWHQLQLGGLICLHGQHKAVVDWENTDVARKNAMPMFFYHGSNDRTLHLKNAEKSYEYLRQHGVQVEL